MPVTAYGSLCRFDIQMTTLFFLQRLSLFSFIETFEPKQQVYSPLLAVGSFNDLLF
jgi:hypothetical protein